MTTCKACGGTYVAGERCPARGDDGHRRPRGRPQAGASDLRATELRVRLSPAEWADVSELARLTGQTASTAVRAAVTRALRLERRRALRGEWKRAVDGAETMRRHANASPPGPLRDACEYEAERQLGIAVEASMRLGRAGAR